MAQGQSIPEQAALQQSIRTGRMKRVLMQIGMSLLAFLILAIFLIPLFYGMSMSLKSLQQVGEMGTPWWPASKAQYNYDGKDRDIYRVPTDTGIRDLALAKPGRDQSIFVDPANPEAGEIVWVGKWRTLERVWKFDPIWENYPYAWKAIDFIKLLRNTVGYAVITTIGAVGSAALVAYGFSRFPIPKKDALFMIVMATIILPPAVYLIPTYAAWNQLDMIGSWFPLMLPHFFSNGYNIFLLRQFFMGIPRELDEAATIDGAGPARVFFSVILPQSLPALVAVTLFHFFFAWNDFLPPLIYLAGHRDKFPITVGLTAFNQLYTQETNYIQAAALIAAALPLAVFFVAQRYFMQGIVMTGVEK